MFAETWPIQAGWHAWSLEGAATEFFGLTGGHHNKLFILMYDAIVSDSVLLSSEPNVGTEEHCLRVWLWARELALGKGIGSNTTMGRWMCWEQQSECFFEKASVELMLLLFLGVKRKWWK